MASVYIEGLDDCYRFCDRLPENVVKMTEKAMREASKKTARQIRQRTPQRFRRLVRYKVFRGQVTNKTNALIGYFNKRQKANNSRLIPDWFKAYWKNYGTLTGRDPSHHFDQPVKGHVKGRRNNVGQPAENFFEAASEGWEAPFMEAFNQAMKDNEKQLYDR